MVAGTWLLDIKAGVVDSRRNSLWPARRGKLNELIAASNDPGLK